jgi:RHS repeat-associated protein
MNITNRKLAFAAAALLLLGGIQTASSFYNPEIGRWANRDPVGEQGGLNLYGFGINDPVNSFDPFGLDVAVVIGHTFPGSDNPFGHAAIAITGAGVYSFGTATPFGTNLVGYLQDQSTRRDSTVIIIKTTLEEDKKIIDYLDSIKNTPVGRHPDNCANRVNQALAAGGLHPVVYPRPTGVLVSPVGVPPGSFPAQTKEAAERIQGRPGRRGGTVEIPQGGTVPMLPFFGRP